jgi:CoA:oxalate CoA-transferase
VSDSQIGAFAIPGNPVRFSKWSEPRELKADILGQHNDEILGELGLSPEEISGLYAEKVLVQDPALRPATERRQRA